MHNQDEIQYFASYGGLGRVALMWGVPLIPFLLLVFLALLGLMVGFIVWGFLVGLILAAFPVSTILAMKVLCELDDRAVEVFRWKCRGMLAMLPNLLSGQPIIRVGMQTHSWNKRRRQLAYQCFKENRA